MPNYLGEVSTNTAVMLSGLTGCTTWCGVCHNLTDHNTRYHHDIINLHREKKENA